MAKKRHGAELLAAYLKANKEKQRAFAERAVIAEDYLSRYLSRTNVPGLLTAFRIEQATGGKVPAESWIDRAEAP